MSHAAPDPSPARWPQLLAALLTLVFLVVLARTAWLSDDALISLRTVLNVSNGFGLTYNIAERVQTFTHPLWLGLLTVAYLIVGNVYYATFALAVLCAGAAFWLAVRHAGSGMQSLLAAVILLWSRAFVDFSTSGLENPLSYLLLALAVGLFLNDRLDRRRWLAGLWLLASLLYLTRPDDVLLVAPMVAIACWRVRRLGTIAVACLVGIVPAAAWTLFSLLYYGFPFPNTAYAKLATGIHPAEMRTQGGLYLLDSLARDPLSLTAIALALAVAAVRRATAARALAAGVALYLLYVVSIGGDFMAGRFIAVPLFGAALVLGRLVTLPRAVSGVLAATLVVVGSTAPHVPLWSDTRFDDSAAGPSGIVDERGVFFRERSLVQARRATFRNPNWPSADWQWPATRVVDTCGLMGVGGIQLGAYVHLLDECALADPLLARLPAIYNAEWRSGHFLRLVPAGYRQTLETGENVIEDPRLREYYDHLRLIVRADDLWSAARLRTIVAMNRGAYDHLIDRPFYRHGGSRVWLREISAPRPDGAPWDDPRNRTLETPLAIACEARAGRRYLSISLDSDDVYVLTFLKGGRLVDRLELGPVPEYRRTPGLVDYTVDVPPGARAAGFDTVVVAPVGGNDRYAMGHLLLEGLDEATDALLYRRVAGREGMVAR